MVWAASKAVFVFIFSDATYDDMKAKLLEHAANNECRYACFDLEFKTPLEGNPANKIVFVAW